MTPSEKFLAFIQDVPDLKKSKGYTKNKIWTSQVREFLEQFQLSQGDTDQLNEVINRLATYYNTDIVYDELDLFLKLLLRKGLSQKPNPNIVHATPVRAIQPAVATSIQSKTQPSIATIADATIKRMIEAREESRRSPIPVETFQTVTPKTIAVNQGNKTNKIFIVHGHDETSKLELARTLEKMGLEPIILHEQPSQGKTIMEKFEEYSKDVNFAFVLLTPDDIGGTDKSDLKKRARQNVILELGFFISQLGRSKVCCLHKSEVELPTDYLGVIFLPFVNSPKECYADIIRELKSAGFNLKL